MGYKRVIQLRGLKDKVSKRYFVNIRFHHKGKFLFEIQQRTVLIIGLIIG